MRKGYWRFVVVVLALVFVVPAYAFVSEARQRSSAMF